MRRQATGTRLTGKVALVTGGTLGIGAAIVRLFAREGAQVAFCARRSAAGLQLEAELATEHLSVSFWPCDVAVESEARCLIERTVERYGRLDVVVNNAGVSASAPLEATSLEEWRRVVENNLTSMFLICKHAIPHLRRSGSGSIVNLGSTYGVVGAPRSAAYAVTKAAAINLSRTLAAELAADGIRVNALCPGATDTPLHRRWRASQPDPEAAWRALVDRHPMGRLATPEEVAMGALYLASDESSFVTGHALMVDGGYTAI
ncbi:MAG TPA: SDR family NAD(P)-dependent oxidoreductase [Candidatus Dormibacteraeota bacterium]|nr:SDR family NAD(P)-dependent oxidoreductase [Candidatus Dormibacteraeota bacterium]